MNSNTFALVNGHKVEFYVNEEKGAVCAVIKNCRYDAYDYVVRKFGGTDDGYAVAGHVGRMTDTCRAVAHCKAPDVFDEQRGKEIAYVKLCIKYWSRMTKRIDDCYYKIHKVASMTTAVSSEVFQKCYKFKDDYDDMCREVDKDKQAVSADNS